MSSGHLAVRSLSLDTVRQPCPIAFQPRPKAFAVLLRRQIRCSLLPVDLAVLTAVHPRKRGDRILASLVGLEVALFLPTTRLARVEACLGNQNAAFPPTLRHGGACLRRALFRTQHRSTGASPAGAKKRVLRGFLVFKHHSTGASPVVVDEKGNFKRRIRPKPAY